MLADALAALRDSMADRVIGIDLEWRPDLRRGFQNRVALMQLASTTRAVLIRTCCMDGLPPCLSAFLRCMLRQQQSPGFTQCRVSEVKIPDWQCDSLRQHCSSQVPSIQDSVSLARAHRVTRCGPAQGCVHSTGGLWVGHC